MSFDPLVKALEENPALAEELGNAKTPRERDAILDAHGIEKPDPDSQFPEAGGFGSMRPGPMMWYVHHPDGSVTMQNTPPTKPPYT